MKRTVLACCICLWPLVAGAQSTCETRVDAHPHATTMQRVDYCLNAPQAAPASNPGLVFSGVTPRHPATQQPAPKGTAREDSFKADKITEERSFVDTPQFPQFKNDTLSEREIWEVHQEAAKQLPAQGQAEPMRQPVERQMEPLPVITQKTKAGLKARKTKPGRRLMQGVAAEKETTLNTAESATQEVAPAADEYMYNTANTQPYAPATPDAQEYVPATPQAQEYVPAEVAAEPYAPAGQEEIPVGTSSYAPAN